MTYAMTLDNSWQLMTEDEMYDVNGGGIYVSNSTLTAILGAGLTLTAAQVVFYGTVVKVALGAMFAAIPVWGQIAIGFLLAISAADVGWAVFEAMTQNKGIMIDFKYRNVFGVKIPNGLDFTVM